MSQLTVGYIACLPTRRGRQALFPTQGRKKLYKRADSTIRPALPFCRHLFKSPTSIPLFLAHYGKCPSAPWSYGQTILSAPLTLLDPESLSISVGVSNDVFGSFSLSLCSQSLLTKAGTRTFECGMPNRGMKFYETFICCVACLSHFSASRGP